MTTMAEPSMSNFMSVLGFLNGMIGGTILILPILGIKTGYIDSLFICILIGFIEFYTCYLLIMHIGKSKSMKQCILSHFQNDQKYIKIYSFIVWFGFVPIFFIYFKLIVLQFSGLFGYSDLIAPLSAILLFFAIVAVRVWEIGEETLAYGIASIITYILFITWSQVTAPEGDKQVPPFGEISSMTSSLFFAFSVINIVGQNIFKNKNKDDHVKLVAYTFLFGTIIYSYITFGSFSIVNRIPLVKNPETISDYFERGGWQITVIEILYIIHLFSAFPNFTIISKIRFYEIGGVQLKSKVSWSQIVYIFVVVMVSFLVYKSGIQLDTLIELNGAIIGYLIVLVVPVYMHLKCVYYDKYSGTIDGDESHNSEIKFNNCECENHYSSKWTLYLQTFFLLSCCIAGIFLIVSTLQSKLAK